LLSEPQATLGAGTTEIAPESGNYSEKDYAKKW